jgi:hypothetical protein
VHTDLLNTDSLTLYVLHVNRSLKGYFTFARLFPVSLLGITHKPAESLHRESRGKVRPQVMSVSQLGLLVAAFRPLIAYSAERSSALQP